MARYGTFKYGAELYGTTDETENGELTVALEVDWDNDGLWSGDNEALRARKVSSRRGRQKFLRSEGNGFEPVREGSMIAEVSNMDGRYDPYDTDSPIYPYVLPGAKFRLRVKDNATDTVYDIMTGYISDIQPIATSECGAQWCQITGVDGFDYLQRVKISTTLQTDYTVDEAIEAILDGVDWPDGYSIDNTLDTMDYWWARGRTAIQEIDELSTTTGSVFFMANDGTAKLYNRIRAATSALTIDEDDIISISIPQPWEVVRNAISAWVRPRVAQSTDDIWTLNDTPFIEAGDSLEVFAQFSYNGEIVPAENVITPEDTTDYTANTESDGSGSDLTSDFSVSADIFGDTAKLTITNNGATDGYITLLKVRGDPITTTQTRVTVDDTTSITRYQKREFEIDSYWQQNVDGTIDMITLILAFLKDPQPFPRLYIRYNPAVQFAVDLFDTVTLDIAARDIDADYRVGYIEHEFTEAGIGNVCDTIMTFEVFYGSGEDWWIFPTAIGETSIFGG